MFSLRSLFLPVLAVLALALVPSARSENLPADHPAAALVTKYLTAVVAQDWETSGSLLAEASLEKKKRETVELIRNAPTMTDESVMLSKLGVKDLAELEAMSPQAFYAAERRAIHERTKVDPAVIEKKLKTLKINILGLVGENDGKIVHALVRTSQETLKERIIELILISLEKAEGADSKWVIVPDMMRPMAEPLSAAP